MSKPVIWIKILIEVEHVAEDNETWHDDVNRVDAMP